MPRIEADLKSCMLVNQFKSEFYNWTDEELKSLEKAEHGDPSEFLNVLENRFKNSSVKISEMHYILHDKDTAKVWDELKGYYVHEQKTPHFHCVIKFADSTPVTLTAISNILGIEAQNIEKPKRGRNSYSNMLAYLIHIKYIEKHKYNPNEVVSKGVKSYLDYYAELKESWEKGKTHVKKTYAKENIDLLLEKILNGELTRQQIILTDEYYTIYSKYSRMCDDALKVYAERRALQTLQALDNGEFKLTVYFIVGESGSGKSATAKKLINDLIERSRNEMQQPFRFCKTAANNPLDDYYGEEILLMDDVRGTALNAADWLKLLDPYHASPGSARYKNKQMACRFIIITTTIEPVTFFSHCKQNSTNSYDRECMNQFLRRIQCLTRIIRTEDNNTMVRITEGDWGDERTVLVPSRSESRKYERVNVKYHHNKNLKEFNCIDEAVEYLGQCGMKNNNLK